LQHLTFHLVLSTVSEFEALTGSYDTTSKERLVQ
jgi:hypothetical protein